MPGTGVRGRSATRRPPNPSTLRDGHGTNLVTVTGQILMAVHIPGASLPVQAAMTPAPPSPPAVLRALEVSEDGAELLALLFPQPAGLRVHRIKDIVRVLRFLCVNASCPKVTFVMQESRLASRYCRRSIPLTGMLTGFGLELAGRAGARTCCPAARRPPWRRG